MNFQIEKFNQYNLPQGAKYSICPICSEHRRKKMQKCMMLDWEKGLGTCQHCGEVIQLHTYKSQKDQHDAPKKMKYKTPVQMPARQISLIPESLFKATLRSYGSNTFCTYLRSLFGEEKARELITLYNIGTSKHWNGATVFWQIDRNNKIRSGKVMLYDSLSGKRVKQPFNHITWVHTLLKLNDFNLSQCFFGEHLLKQNKPIAIVESEKTAIIASAYLAKFTWLAIGSLNNLSTQRFKILEGKTVVLYPDLNGYNLWKEKADKISQETDIKFIVSELLEKNASNEERKNGLDLADYLVKFPWEDSAPQLSEEEQRLNVFFDINPSLKSLIEKLDLVLID
jgi:hypothetical protein